MFKAGQEVLLPGGKVGIVVTGATADDFRASLPDAIRWITQAIARVGEELVPVPRVIVTPEPAE